MLCFVKEKKNNEQMKNIMLTIEVIHVAVLRKQN